MTVLYHGAARRKNSGQGLSQNCDNGAGRYGLQTAWQSSAANSAAGIELFSDQEYNVCNPADSHQMRLQPQAELPLRYRKDIILLYTYIREEN